MSGTDQRNLFDNLPERLPQELFETLAAGDGVRIERILSQGQASPEGFWYDQEQHEFVLLLQGAARIGFDDGSERVLGPGDYLNLPAHCRHRVAWTDPAQLTVWLAVFY